MKTYTIKKSEAQSRPEQSATKQEAYRQHNANRKLEREQVLDLLLKQLPKQFEAAEIVGNWIWLAKSDIKNPLIAETLWTLGFHFNARRHVWQHPGGKLEPFGTSPEDPRKRYGSYYAAGTKHLRKGNV